MTEYVLFIASLVLAFVIGLLLGLHILGASHEEMVKICEVQKSLNRPAHMNENGVCMIWHNGEYVTISTFLERAK